MSAEIFATLAIFAFVTSITPGPNNFMLLASGVNFGFKRTVPHMLGIGSGFFALLLAVGFGLGELLERFPPLFLSLKFAGGAYLLFLAYRIALSRSLGEDASSGKPMSFLAAAAFQWVNPKAWVMAVTAMATYTEMNTFLLSVFLVSIVFTLVNVPSIAAWAGFGSFMREWLSNPTRLKWFNISMGVLLAVSLWPMLR
ncbi:MAG: LysE family translocator [Hyphomicrobiales bacterium]